jgi:hypothetical protein
MLYSKISYSFLFLFAFITVHISARYVSDDKHQLDIHRLKRSIYQSICEGDEKLLQGHRSKRSICFPISGNGKGNIFKGRTFEQIDKDFRSKRFKIHGKDPLNGKGQYECPITGARFYLDKGGDYKTGREFRHVDVWLFPIEHPNFKAKFPLGDKLTDTITGDIKKILFICLLKLRIKLNHIYFLIRSSLFLW